MNLEKVTVARADGQGQVGHFRSPSADTYLQLNVNVELNRTYTYGSNERNYRSRIIRYAKIYKYGKFNYCNKYDWK